MVSDQAPPRIAHIRLTLADLRRRWRTVALVVLVAAAAGTATAFLVPSNYTAAATFYPEGKSTPDLSALSGSLGGLGALMSLAGGSGGGMGSGFFVDLLKSQTFLDTLATSVIPIDSAGHRMTVERFVIKRAKNDGDRRWKARKALKKMIEVSTEPAGIVVVSVEAKSPVAAAAMANRAVDVIDALNLKFRRDQAAARRKFTETFLGDVQGRLSASENQLEDFLMSNRSLISLRTASQNPVLQAQQERLRAEVTRLRTLKEQLESTIENARLTEFNDAPVVARVDRSRPPEKRSGPSRPLIVLGTILLAMTALLWTAYVRVGRQQIQ